MKAYARRVNVELKKRVQELKATAPASGAKHISDSRKEYLNAKAERKRRKALGLPADDDEAAMHMEKVAEGGKGGSSGAAATAGGKRPRSAMAASRDDDDDDDGAHKPAGGAGAPSTGSIAASGAGSGKAAGGAGPAGKRQRATEFPTDHVAFGERADAPPVLKVAPRKSKVSASLSAA